MRKFMLGLILGTVAGVLYAPATGSRTRTLLKDKLSSYSRETAELLDSTGTDIRGRVGEVKSTMNDAMGQVKEQVNKVQGVVQNQVNQVRDQVQNKVEQLHERSA